jgi:hypothetical protein
MIKITVTKDTEGVAYNKEVFVWFALYNKNKTTFDCSFTFHKSAEQAETDTVFRTEKELHKLTGLNDSFSVNISDIVDKLTVDELKTKIQELAIADMNTQIEESENNRIGSIVII